MLGAHNAFFQVTIWWGVTGLAALCYAIWRLARLVPPLRSTDPYEIALVALSLTLFLRLFVTHVIYAKSFSIGIGLLVARRLAQRSET
jgi:hypothetical protein